jgi:hypothetical protein
MVATLGSPPGEGIAETMQTAPWRLCNSAVEFQLRVYSVKPGAMSAWVEESRRNVAPLGRRFGFKVIGPWVIEAEDKFVWILAYDGEQGWEAADAAHYTSEERRPSSRRRRGTCSRPSTG